MQKIDPAVLMATAKLTRLAWWLVVTAGRGVTGSYGAERCKAESPQYKMATLWDQSAVVEEKVQDVLEELNLVPGKGTRSGG